MKPLDTRQTSTHTSPDNLPPALSEWRRQQPAVGNVMRTIQVSLPTGSTVPDRREEIDPTFRQDRAAPPLRHLVERRRARSGMSVALTHRLIHAGGPDPTPLPDYRPALAGKPSYIIALSPNV